jgi:hypothetical protein
VEPIHSTISAHQVDTVQARARSLVQRLLSGAGRASLVAFDLSPDVVEAIDHGLSETGELMVACIADDGVAVTTWGQLPLRVRLDVVKEAPEWSVRITACATHLLGELEWLADDVRESYLSCAGLPARMVELASAPGGRLGVVHTERVLLHDATGVIAVPFAEIVDGPSALGAFPDAEQEWAAREVAGHLSRLDIVSLFDAADAGWDAAITLSSGGQGGCPHLDGEVFCVDVDRTGLTLMAIESGLTTVVLFAFASPAGDANELADRLGQLISGAAAFSAARS